MIWPCRRELWGDRLDAACHEYAHVARTIARSEPVLMVAPPGSGRAAARSCGRTVEVVEMPVDDSWSRDSGPLVAFGPSGRVAVDFRFDAWGRKFAPFDDDALFGARLAELLGLPHRPVDLILEGGALVVDGAGTAVTTEQCLLRAGRNPGVSRAEIEAVLARELTVRNVVWVPDGLAEDADTDGHVDNVVAFVQPGKVAVQVDPDPAAPNHDRLATAARTLIAAGLDVVEIGPLPYTSAGRSAPATPVPYVNWYVANELVVVPTCGHPADARVLAQVADLYDREAVPAPATALAYGGGGVHCITLQIPAPHARGS